MVGKNKMTKWKSAVATWMQKLKEKEPKLFSVTQKLPLFDNQTFIEGMNKPTQREMEIFDTSQLVALNPNYEAYLRLNGHLK